MLFLCKHVHNSFYKRSTMSALFKYVLFGSYCALKFTTCLTEKLISGGQWTFICSFMKLWSFTYIAVLHKSLTQRLVTLCSCADRPVSDLACYPSKKWWIGPRGHYLRFWLWLPAPDLGQELPIYNFKVLFHTFIHMLSWMGQLWKFNMTTKTVEKYLIILANNYPNPNFHGFDYKYFMRRSIYGI